MGRPRKDKTLGSGFLGIFKPVFTIAVLTAFVLGISFGVKAIATSDTSVIASLVSPLFAKLNIKDTKLGTVAGAFVSRLSQSGDAAVNTSESGARTSAPIEEKVSPVNTSYSENDVIFKIAFLSDSHSDYDNLSKALTIVKTTDVKHIFFLGDYTELGVTDDLEKAKKIMDSTVISYNSLPGDHDLWKSVGPQNFLQIFGSANFVKTIGDIKFVGLDNSANYTTISSEKMEWFKTQITDADYVLLSQPLYHKSNDIIMGFVNGVETPKVHAQALELLTLIRGSKVRAIIAGDQHMSSDSSDPERSDLHHIVIGAITKDRNLQTPRFSIMKMLKNGDYVFEQVLLK